MSSGTTVHTLLEQAEALARSGDVDGAAARAREARRCARARVDVEDADLALDRLLTEAQRWQAANEARRRGYVARERSAVAAAERAQPRI